MFIAVIFVSSLLMANIMANYMFVIFKWSVDGGFFLFPLTYILSDVVSEVYGYKWSRRIAWTSLAINAVFALLIKLLVTLPTPEHFDGSAFEIALSGSWRIVLASLIAYCVGDLADDRIFRALRKGRDSMKGFAFRALASSLVGHILDTTLFCTIAFAPAFGMDGIPWGDLPGMIILGICLKWTYEWLALPLSYRVVKWARQKEGLSI